MVRFTGASRELVSVNLMGEAKQSGIDRSRLFCRSFYDNYAAFISDFLSVQTGQKECPYYLRIGKLIELDQLRVNSFGAPCIYSPFDGPIRQRALVAEEGWFVGSQCLDMTNKWKLDGKLLNASDKEMRVYESMYTVQMKVDTDPRYTPNKSDTESRDDEVDILDNAVLDVSLEPEVKNNIVASIKMLREHMLEMPSRRQGDMSMIEKSAIFEMGPFQIEGLYIDQDLQTEVDQQASNIAETKMRGTSLKDSILKVIRQPRPQNEKGELAQGKSRRGKRRKNKQRSKAHDRDTSMTGETDLTSMERHKRNQNPKKTKLTGTTVAKVGDLVSAPATIFDNEPDSFSSKYPERWFGAVEAVIVRRV
jgi:hypothetical protein